MFGTRFEQKKPGLDISENQNVKTKHVNIF